MLLSHHRVVENKELKELNTIIAKSIDGIEAAQRELYLLHRTKWYMQCLRYGKSKNEADDILQESLIQIYKDLYQFDEKRASFITWSSRLIAHTALRYLKKNSWHQTFTNLDEVYDLAEKQETVYDKLAAKELIELIRALPTGYRLVFNMFVLEGYSHKEIAEHLKITEGTSKSQLFKAKRMLREKFEFQLTEELKK